MKQFEFVVKDPAGMHARPASILSKEASKYASTIEITANQKKGNLKSIMGIMSMGILSGQAVEISISGEDEQAAFDAIQSVLKDQDMM